MVKRTAKKITSLILLLFICFSLLPNFSVVTFAADGIEMRLEKLKAQFPEGMYWNHPVLAEKDKIANILKNLDESYADSVTAYPCTSHDYEVGRGSYDCNYFDEGYQCHGFAARLFYKIFGVRQSTLDKIDRRVYEIQPGDLVRLKNNTHSGIVLSVNGLKFTVVECNVVELGGKPSCEIKWGRSCNITDITYYVHAPNYNNVKNDTNWKSFEAKANIGSGFYAAIVNDKSNMALTVDKSNGNNIVVRSFTGAANQMWKFTRLANGSYKIISCLDSTALDIGSFFTATRANVKTGAYADLAKQKWAFYGTGTKFYVSPDEGNSVLCLENGAYAAGTNVLVTEKINHAAQIFKVVKLNPPDASVITAVGGVNNVLLSWTKTAYTDTYTVEIYRDGSLYKTFKNMTVNSGRPALPAGNYCAKVYTKNAFTAVAGNTAYFTVSDKNVLGRTAKVATAQNLQAIKLAWTPVPGATGYRIFFMKGNKWQAAATTTKTVHTFTRLPSATVYTFAIRAYSIANGKVTWAPSFTTFTASTQAPAPAKIAASQTASSIKLAWTPVNNADGYIIYSQTSSGWRELVSVTETTMSFSGLPSGRKYTFAVKPYIKTSTGTVMGVYRTFQTATRPAAPKLSIENQRALGADVLWKAVEGADGFEVFYRLDNTSYTLLNDLDGTKRGIAISKMEYNTYYTIAVRAYAKVGGVKIYSDLSTVRFRAQILG